MSVTNPVYEGCVTVKLEESEEDTGPMIIDYESLKISPSEPLSTLPFSTKVPLCSLEFDDFVTFCRVAELKAFDVLKNPAKKRILLTGSPGVGKTTVAWRYALSQSA